MFKAEDAKEYCRRNDADAAEMAKSITNLRNQNVDAYRDIGRLHAVLTAYGVPLTALLSTAANPEQRNLSVNERIEKFVERWNQVPASEAVCSCKHCESARAVQRSRDSYIPPAEGPQ